MTSTVPTLRPGDQLASTVCGARVVVIRAAGPDVPTVSCGGSPMVRAQGAPAPSSDEGAPLTLIGKRYVNADDTLEVLCVASGSGALSCDGVPMTGKAAKPLPASD